MRAAAERARWTSGEQDTHATPHGPRVQRSALEVAGALLATGAVLALLLRAIGRFDDSWDSTAYHLPFAAFRAGLRAAP